MEKQFAINWLGGTPGKAAKAMGYKSVHAVYMWPDTLPVSVADRVTGAADRLGLTGNTKSIAQQEPKAEKGV
jgi:hypothetical protein